MSDFEKDEKNQWTKEGAIEASKRAMEVKAENRKKRTDKVVKETLDFYNVPYEDPIPRTLVSVAIKASEGNAPSINQLKQMSKSPTRSVKKECLHGGAPECIYCQAKKEPGGQKLLNDIISVVYSEMLADMGEPADYIDKG